MFRNTWKKQAKKQPDEPEKTQAASGNDFEGKGKGKNLGKMRAGVLAGDGGLMVDTAQEARSKTATRGSTQWRQNVSKNMKWRQLMKKLSFVSQLDIEFEATGKLFESFYFWPGQYYHALGRYQYPRKWQQLIVKMIFVMLAPWLSFLKTLLFWKWLNMLSPSRPSVPGSSFDAVIQYQ